MKLKVMLSELSQPRLANLIQNWGGKIQKSVSMNELINQLSSLMQNPVNLEKAVNYLTPSDRNLLGILLMYDGNIDIPKLSELVKGNELYYGFSFYISHIESRGLFFVKSMGKNPTIIVAEELMKPLRELLIKYNPVYNIDTEKLVIKEASPILDDIFRICIFSMNQGGIRMTQQGQLFKKAKQELLDILGSENEIRLQFAIDIMTSWHLLEHRGKMLHSLDENAQYIFSKRKEKITMDMIYPKHINNKLTAKFLGFLSQNSENDWIDFRDFIESQKSIFFEKKDIEGWQQFDTYKLTKLVYGLYFIGIIDLKHYEKQAHEIHSFEIQTYAQIHSFKISPFGKRVIEASDKKKEAGKRHDRSFIVSPNFEINIFGEEPDYYAMYRLGKIAKMLRFDSACTFRLEKELVMRELTNGTTLPDIISFLETNSKKELPQNVRYSLLDWGAKFGKVTAGKGYIELIARSLHERVEQILLPYIVRSITNPVIIFDEKKEAEVLSKLRKADIFPSELKKSSSNKKTNEEEDDDE